VIEANVRRGACKSNLPGKPSTLGCLAK